LIRAQLIEEGFDVLATDSWTTARSWLRPGSKPSLMIVDLDGLPEPEQVLDSLAVLMQPHAVLVVTAVGTVPLDQLQARGFSVLSRPISIADVVGAASRAAGLRRS
jgi:hypothetical protein